jgi:hypothetical protein
MLAAAAGLRVPSETRRFAVEHGGVSGERRQTGAIWSLKTYPLERYIRFRGAGSITFRQFQRQAAQLILELSADNRRHSERSQIRGINGCIKAIAA